jgi:hypothetical protein
VVIAACFQEEERRIATVMARKEEEKKREVNKLAILKVPFFTSSFGLPKESLCDVFSLVILFSALKPLIPFQPISFSVAITCQRTLNSWFSLIPKGIK